MSITINRQYISQKNINGTGNPCKYIVVHETDNTNKGAGAKTHANAQYSGHFSDMSVHYYCGSDGIYQAAEHTCKCWHVGKSYTNNPNVADCSNNNSIGIEICVNSDGDYNTARNNAIVLVKHLIQATSIPASRVIRHYDAKGKYCPRKMLDNPVLWTDFRNQIGNTITTTEPSKPQAVEKYYRVGTAWEDGVCINQVGAYTVLGNAKSSCAAGYKVYDWDGKLVYENKPTSTAAPEPTSKGDEWVRRLQAEIGVGVDGIPGPITLSKLPLIKSGSKGNVVKLYQERLNTLGYASGTADGIFGVNTKSATIAFQSAKKIAQDGIAGVNTWRKILGL